MSLLYLFLIIYIPILGNQNKNPQCVNGNRISNNFENKIIMCVVITKATLRWLKVILLLFFGYMTL